VVAVRAGARNGLTDVGGLRVGHAQRVGGGWLSGVTVVLAPEGGVVAAVDVRGGGPATRETDALDPRNLVERIDAVVLTGGSAYGLASADGVMGWLEERGRGVRIWRDRPLVVPVVPTAALFDLGRGGDVRARPDAALGRAAVEAASEDVACGCVGAGTGAIAGGFKGGIGTASVVLGSGVTVAALVAVNAVGAPVDLATGALHGVFAEVDGEFGGLGGPVADEAVRERARRRLAGPDLGPLNTTLAVVATDADLTRARTQKLAGTAHDGIARAIRPTHLLTDGDTVFALATGERPVDGVLALNEVLAAGADVLTRAVVRAILSAESMGGVPCYRELYELG
jgi:L-aminopeptidase/D-esterase-like protein